MATTQTITPRDKDYSQWYLDVVDQAELAENSAVRGCMVIKPYGYALWENYQKVLDTKFKEFGHVNAYFPLFIPKSFLAKEAEHVEGFAQESAIVTHYRLKTDPKTKKVTVDPEAKLEEELIVRPTSETIIYDTYSRWVKSYRDLPILINQWANVVRWEMRTRPFLRTAEFLWQEGHTVHATHNEAEEEARKMLGVYQWFAEEYLAMPVVPGQKSESEKFAGALRTYTIEALMQDGKALQSGTSHNLGDNFAKAFNIQYADKDGAMKYAWQTSWGFSTRMIGGLIMAHSDDQGLVLPPKIAPIQVVIVPVIPKEESRATVMKAVEGLAKELKHLAVKVDDRDYLTTGEKFYEWEKKGVPVRLEVGPRDIENRVVVAVRRDTKEKSTIVQAELKKQVDTLLDDIQISLYQKAKQFREDHTFKVDSYDEFEEIIDQQKGFVLAHWDGTKETEAKIKAQTKATIRCIPFDSEEEKGKDLLTGKPSAQRAVFAKAY